jgi:hypothetical protein
MAVHDCSLMGPAPRHSGPSYRAANWPAAKFSSAGMWMRRREQSGLSDVTLPTCVRGPCRIWTCRHHHTEGER